jgi:hypothetical protein
VDADEESEQAEGETLDNAQSALDEAKANLPIDGQSPDGAPIEPDEAQIEEDAAPPIKPKRVPPQRKPPSAKAKPAFKKRVKRAA